MLSHDIVDREKILKEINSLDHTKACQQADIYTKIILKNADIFAEVLHLPFNALVNEGANWLMLPQFLEKIRRTLETITDQAVF